ncbi:MAG: DNA-3-methyladenine glycosylase 2 family protein [Clostridia bacterium]|nr:DNA-3-methyladenine glycosylase 2 family protein [Clostridia bacterium]
MEYEITKDEIIVKNATTFNPKATLESGQMFRFECKNDIYSVFAGAEFAKIIQESPENYRIITQNPKFFVNYFDFNTDYDIIQKELSKFDAVKPALQFAKGVRILKQDIFETLVCFIISANNNIKRIKKSVGLICENFGTKTSWGYAFPTPQQLKRATESDFVKFGLGYRAPYMVDTVAKIVSGWNLEEIKNLPTEKAREKLLTLKGVGPKVADCILLFGAGKKDVFPVDTWIEKVWHDQFNGQTTNRKQIAKELVNTFQDYSGICQQYMFYYKRELKI